MQVSGIKALGEPAVDRGQHIMGCGTFALLLPQSTQAHGGTQFERLRLLAAGDRKSTRLNSSHTEISTLSLHDALPIWGQHIMGCGTFALLLPQSTQAHGGTQFERLRLLAA